MKDPYPVPPAGSKSKVGGDAAPEPLAITYTNIPTGWDATKLNEVFTKLVAKADENWSNVVHAHVPEYLQANLAQFLAAAAPPVTGPTNALVVDQQVIPLTSPAGASVQLTVVNSVITAAVLTMPASWHIVKNGDAVPVKNSAGATVTNGAAVVTTGNLASVDLPATVAGVSNGASVPITGQGVNGTATVAAGALSGVQLAATQHVVKNGDSVVVHDLADANVPGSPGTATVAAGALSKVNLTV